MTLLMMMTMTIDTGNALRMRHRRARRRRGYALPARLCPELPAREPTNGECCGCCWGCLLLSYCGHRWVIVPVSLLVLLLLYFNVVVVVVDCIMRSLSIYSWLLMMSSPRWPSERERKHSAYCLPSPDTMVTRHINESKRLAGQDYITNPSPALVGSGVPTCFTQALQGYEGHH